MNSHNTSNVPCNLTAADTFYLSEGHIWSEPHPYPDTVQWGWSDIQVYTRSGSFPAGSDRLRSAGTLVHSDTHRYLTETEVLEDSHLQVKPFLLITGSFIVVILIKSDWSWENDFRRYILLLCARVWEFHSKLYEAFYDLLPFAVRMFILMWYTLWLTHGLPIADVLLSRRLPRKKCIVWLLVDVWMVL